MRKVNYWKTLLVVLCTGCIFAACGDDDDEKPVHRSRQQLP